MQREKYPLDTDVVVPLQPFNTPGTEVAPRSDKVGEHFQSDWFAHDLNVIITVAAVIEAVNPTRFPKMPAGMPATPTGATRLRVCARSLSAGNGGSAFASAIPT